MIETKSAISKLLRRMARTHYRHATACSLWMHAVVLAGSALAVALATVAVVSPVEANVPLAAGSRIGADRIEAEPDRPILWAFASGADVPLEKRWVAKATPTGPSFTHIDVESPVTPKRQPYRDLGFKVSSIAVDAANNRLAVGDYDGDLILFDLADLTRFVPPKIHVTGLNKAAITALAFDATGENLFAGDEAHNIFLYSVKDILAAPTATGDDGNKKHSSDDSAAMAQSAPSAKPTAHGVLTVPFNGGTTVANAVSAAFLPSHRLLLVVDTITDQSEGTQHPKNGIVGIGADLGSIDIKAPYAMPASLNPADKESDNYITSVAVDAAGKLAVATIGGPQGKHGRVVLLALDDKRSRGYNLAPATNSVTAISDPASGAVGLPVNAVGFLGEELHTVRGDEVRTESGDLPAPPTPRHSLADIDGIVTQATVDNDARKKASQSAQEALDRARGEVALYTGRLTIASGGLGGSFLPEEYAKISTLQKQMKEAEATIAKQDDSGEGAAPFKALTDLRDTAKSLAKAAEQKYVDGRADVVDPELIENYYAAAKAKLPDVAAQRAVAESLIGEDTKIASDAAMMRESGTVKLLASKVPLAYSLRPTPIAQTVVAQAPLSQAMPVAQTDGGQTPGLQTTTVGQATPVGQTTPVTQTPDVQAAPVVQTSTDHLPAMILSLSFPAPADEIAGVERFDPGRLLAISGDTVSIWDTNSVKLGSSETLDLGKPIIARSVSNPSTSVSVFAACFIPETKAVLYGGSDKNVWWWFPESGTIPVRPLYPPDAAFPDDVLNAAFPHKTCGLLAITTWRRGQDANDKSKKPFSPKLYLKSIDRRTLLPVPESEQRVLFAPLVSLGVAVAFSPNDSKIAVGCYNNTIEVFDTAQLQIANKPHKPSVIFGNPPSKYKHLLCMAFIDDNRVVWGGSDGILYVGNIVTGNYDPVDKQETTTSQVSTEEVTTESPNAIHSIAFGTGGRLVTGCKDGRIRTYLVIPPESGNPGGDGITDVYHGIHLLQLDGRDFVRAGTGTVTSLAFRDDGRVLASGGTDGIVRLWSVTLDIDALDKTIKERGR